MPRLPISGWQVTVRQPTGIEDLFLQESPGLDVAVALHLLNRLVQFPPVSTANWKQLSVPDYEALLLLLRRVTLGDMVRAETKCMAAGCGVTADVAFRIGDYLASQTPRMPRGVERLAESDTFRIAGGDAQFRLPNCGDLLALNTAQGGERELMRRCVISGEMPPRMRHRIDRAMESLGPRFSRTLQGQCPECGAKLNSFFDVEPFVLRELRDHAAAIFEDIHLLAYYYKWSESDIVALPRSRRTFYADALRGQRSTA
jgi:hypothetical protein